MIETHSGDFYRGLGMATRRTKGRQDVPPANAPLVGRTGRTGRAPGPDQGPLWVKAADGVVVGIGNIDLVLAVDPQQVGIGQQVREREVIALSGSTGRSTGPHLHFEVLVDGTPVDPLTVVQQPT